MYELHITPTLEFKDDFIDIAKRYKLKLIEHDNLDINGKFLYSETMIAEKCKDISELNKKIELINSVAKQHNLLRTKIESEISENFDIKYPYKLGSTYYEFHIDVMIKNITKELSNICKENELTISKNPNKDTFMLTFRADNLETYKNSYNEVLGYLKDYNVIRKIKEYCFCDDNIYVDKTWLETYKRN